MKRQAVQGDVSAAWRIVPALLDSAGMNARQADDFRFLPDDEFQKLDVKGKALYLVRAQQEIEERQRILRQQMEALLKRVK